MPHQINNPDAPAPAPDAKAHDPVHSEAHPAPAPSFTRDVSASLVAEFRRLALLNGWKKKTKGYKRERRSYFREWAVEDFTREFGTNSGRLEAWQKLLRLLGVGEGLHFGSIPECIGALHGVYVNIVDLIDACKTPGEKPRIFDSSQELAKYTRRTGNLCPIDIARGNDLLSIFLIHLKDASGGGGGTAGRRRRRKAKKAQAAEEKATAEAKATGKKSEETEGKDA